MEARQECGLAIAAKSPVNRNRLGWSVPSLSGKGSNVVNIDGDSPFPTCPENKARQQPCEHIYVVEYVIQREDDGNGTSTYTETARLTYDQQRTAHNICVLIQSVYEQGLEPVFWSDEPCLKSESSALIVDGQWNF